VVNIVSLMPTGVGAGTGVVISADGDVVTNNHVIEGASQIEVTIAGTDETYAATVVGTDPQHDVAVIHLAAAQDLATVPIGDSDDVEVGDAVAAVGNAGGLRGAPKVATGHVIALHQPVTAADETGGNVRTLTDLIEVDAFVQSGDSGGPLVSEDGEVIGINVAASVTTSGGAAEPHVGFAIPINRVISIAEDIIADPSPPAGASNQPALGSGYLGVAAVDSTGNPGASISSVQPKSPAADAGLAAGDVITAVDDIAISSSADLVAALSTYDGGEQATITWLTGGTEHQVTVTLAAR
jgi:S1-C subfamily serine protease